VLVIYGLSILQTKTDLIGPQEYTIKMEKLLHTIFLENSDNLWDTFEAECRRWYSEPVHSFVEMRMRDNKKIRGDIFEEFCVLYMKNVRGYTNAWRLEDVPSEILERLGMKRMDVGIDIILEKDGKYSAVQCKYKKQDKTKSVTWKSLSTFYGLCLRTGPWEKYIVFTNCSCVRHMGRKTPKDISICLKTLQGISQKDWFSMCGVEGRKLEDTTKKFTHEEVISARLKFFERI